MKGVDITNICTGCKCCEDICPQEAISFVPDKEGFWYPIIDQSKCIDCGLCKKRCPQNKSSFECSFQRIALGMRSKDNSILKYSASGGVFATIAKHVISSGGIVIGCAYDENLVAKHIVVKEEKDLPNLYSSKYVQSDTSGIYSLVKKYLLDGKMVLFSGTGCQCAALKSYLNKDYDNLYIADIICHGVPSPLLFEKYKDYLAAVYKSEIKHINFRSKRPKGWGQTLCITYTESKSGKNKTNYVFGKCDPYYKAYLSGKLHRPSCYKCKYTGINRAADFTMGDFWNILKYHSSFYDKKGISEVIINTQKGYDFLMSYMDSFYHIKTTIQICENGNANLIRPEKRPTDRSRLGSVMELSGNDLFHSEYFKIGKFTLLKSRMIFKIPVSLKIYIKRIIYTLGRI